MIRRLFVAVLIAFITVGTFLGLQPSAIAATQDYSPSKQDYPSQSEYDKKQESSDYSYKDKQAGQSRPQEKQSNQADANKKQYAQQEQSCQKE